MAKENLKTLMLKNYFRNLLEALLGRNPLREDMERMRQAHEKNEKEMLALKNLYCDCVDIMDRYSRQIAEKDKQITSLQTLVDNLRERIKEKDGLLELVQHEYQLRMKQASEDFQKKIETYSEEIDRLKGEKK